MDQDQIIKLIQDHFLRQGEFKIVESINQESNIKIDIAFQQKFQNLFNILKEIQNKNLKPALEWCEKNNQELKNVQIKLNFAQVLKEYGKVQAVHYARSNFKHFSDDKINEIQQLMTSILFSDQNNSPYINYLDNQYWIIIEKQIIEETCRMLKILPESILEKCFKAGFISIPKFNKFYQLNQKENEMILDVQLGKEFQYHSQFVCPISKELSNENNPPLMLKCGHIFGKESIAKISANKTKFKCPTCPIETNVDQTKPIYF